MFVRKEKKREQSEVWPAKEKRLRYFVRICGGEQTGRWGMCDSIKSDPFFFLFLFLKWAGALQAFLYK